MILKENKTPSNVARDAILNFKYIKIQIIIYKQKVNFVSLGCAKALVDTEKLLGGLKNTNFDIFSRWSRRC